MTHRCEAVAGGRPCGDVAAWTDGLLFYCELHARLVAAESTEMVMARTTDLPKGS